MEKKFGSAKEYVNEAILGLQKSIALKDAADEALEELQASYGEFDEEEVLENPIAKPYWEKLELEEKVEKKVFYIKALQVDIEMLASTETDSDTKAALTKLAEKIRFSDPMSNEVLAELEAEITAQVKELKTAEDKAEIITVLDSLITERNKKAKLLK